MPLPSDLADLLPPTLPSRFSVSFIGSAGECMLKAKMSREGDASNVFTTIGSIAHEVFATCELMAQFQGRTQVTPEEALEVADRVLGKPEESVGLGLDVYRVVRQQVSRWASAVTFPTDADTWVIEHPFRLPLEDPQDGTVYTISGRMDEVAIWGTHYRNRDWKTGPKLPSRKEVEEEHTQLPLYAWAALREWPWLETFECEEYFTRYGIGRPVNLTLDDVAELDGYLLAACRRIKGAYLRNDFRPTSGPWCNSRCPAPQKCPLPDHAKGDGGYLGSDREAVEQVRAATVEQASAAKRMQAVRAYLDTHPEGTLLVDGKVHGFLENGSGTVKFTSRKA